MGNKLNVARSALFVSAFIAGAEATTGEVNRGDFCPAQSGYFPSTSDDGAWPESWGKCPHDQGLGSHVVTHVTDDCCVASCLSTFLEHDPAPTFTVCAGSDDGGAPAYGDFDWAGNYCDCPLKAYCTFVCDPTCEIPVISRFNLLKGPLQSFAIQGRLNASDAHEDAYKISLVHASRNLCPVFFFAIVRTPNQVVIDWTLSLLYKPWDIRYGAVHTCESIVVDFVDAVETHSKPTCFQSEDHYVADGQCGVSLPRSFLVDKGDPSNTGLRTNHEIRAEYIVYSSCDFKGFRVLEKICYEEDQGQFGRRV